MSGFKVLRGVAANFENYCLKALEELPAAKVSEPFEDVVSKKIRDAKLLTSKLRLLEAISLAVEVSEITQETERETSSILQDYEDTVTSKITEQLIVKAITQNHTLKKFLTTPDHLLKTEFMEKKVKIIEELNKYRNNELQLRSLENELEKSEDTLYEARKKWDEELGKLRNVPKVAPSERLEDGPLQDKLENIIEKSKLMQWLIAKLITSRHNPHYDWLNDLDQRMRALAVARPRYDD